MVNVSLPSNWWVVIGDGCIWWGRCITYLVASFRCDDSGASHKTRCGSLGRVLHADSPWVRVIQATAVDSGSERVREHWSIKSLYNRRWQVTLV